MDDKSFQPGKLAKRLGFLAYVVLIMVIFIIKDRLEAYYGLSYIPIAILAGLVAAAPIYLIAKSAYRSKQLREQKKRDFFPLQEIKFLRSREYAIPERDFRLFLRPFNTVGKLRIANPERPTVYSPSFFEQPGTLDLEFIIAKYLSTMGQVYAVGGPENSVGPGRLHVDDKSWFHNFELLAKAAHCIIVIPGYTLGSTAEVCWLKANFFLDKTIFIMPPSSFGQSGEAKSEWEKTSAAVEDIGLCFPEYKRTGLLFKMNSLGQEVRSETLVLKSNVDFLKCLLKLEEPY